MYRSIASRNLRLYSFGLVIVGLFRPPPAIPEALIRFSSLLSNVYVRTQSARQPLANACDGCGPLADQADNQLLPLFVDANHQRVVHHLVPLEEQGVVPE